MIAASLWKPWYVYRPSQLLRRLATMMATPATEYRPVRAAWGMELLASPAEHQGRSLATTGIYDLAVSETILRLTNDGDLVVDAGANIGYMTLLAAVAAGPQGRVIAFEPNPRLFSVLTENVETARARIQMAPVDVRPTALGSHAHTAVLALPDPKGLNDGVAFIPDAGDSAHAHHTVPIQVETLDDVLDGKSIGLMKIDVEGHEFPLLQGSAVALKSRRIRDIVFEDHQGSGSRASDLLESCGYAMFSMGWSIRGLVLEPSRPGVSMSASYEAPSYLATIDPERALRACAVAGWRALRPQTRLKPPAH